MAIEILKPIDIRPKAGEYKIKPELENAIEVALLFNQPLLLTGEPGTGKTLLAYYVAKQLNEATKNAAAGECQFSPKPLKFNTKTSSIARDLFYIYDAVGHFQNANIAKEETKTEKFIELQAFGKAIAMANPKEEYVNNFIWENNTTPQSSVVLVDEIDKAPRDFTNDLLSEIERYEFFIREKNYQVRLNDKAETKNDNADTKNDNADPKNDNADPKNPQRILVIMTSNSEKNLPDAFLRRCVFFHIEFPKKEDGFLLEILKGQLTIPKTVVSANNLKMVHDLFYDLRKAAIRKKPATAELVAFVKMLEIKGVLDKEDLNVKQWYLDNLALVAKTKEDIDAIRRKLTV